MQGIYTYIPETNYVPRQYSVAAVLLLLFMALTSFVAMSINICSLFIITNYNVWFAVGDSSVSLYLLIPQYGYVVYLYF